jgi:hypothetical protein
MNFNNRLVLFPTITDYKDRSLYKENTTPINSLLLEQKIISTQWLYNDQYYYLVGENFLKYITFMGCSPAIETQPDKNNLPGPNFVAIKIQHLQQVIFYPGTRNYQYRCNNCQGPILLEETKLLLNSDRFNCSQCLEEFHYQQINWRHKAGISHLFIEICGIFNGEAIPADSLLNLLKNESSLKNNRSQNLGSANKWNYFYAQSER